MPSLLGFDLGTPLGRLFIYNMYGYGVFAAGSDLQEGSESLLASASGGAAAAAGPIEMGSGSLSDAIDDCVSIFLSFSPRLDLTFVSCDH